MELEGWTIDPQSGPIVATALHNGHEIRPELEPLLELEDADRLYEEDPYTGTWTVVAPTRYVARTSRFEVDLNRPRAKAVYIYPEDAWGLRVWNPIPAQDAVERSLAAWDAFYAEARRVLTAVEREHGRFVVLDFHSYNHRRPSPDAAPADPAGNPEINIGTSNMDRGHWAPLVDRFCADLRAFDFSGRSLDVRTDVRFNGGHLSRWVHDTFPDTGCVLAIEVKKFFMDEWTGEVDEEVLGALTLAFDACIPGLLEVLQDL